MTAGLDLVITLGLFLSFAAWVTLHVALAVGLASYAPKWRALVVLLPPTALLAPYWGHRAGMKGRSLGWIVSAVAYVILLSLAYR